jgi:purine-binding chemotaxis protein CheW
VKATLLGADTVQFVSFYIGDSFYGLDIRFVKEVNTNVDITQVSLTSPHISGLVNIRGQIVLVIDSSVLFTGHVHALSPDSHLVILKTAQDFEQLESEDASVDLQKLSSKPIALLVDRIGDVITLPKNSIEKAPRHMDEDRAKYVQGIAKTDDFFLIALDPVLLFAGETFQDDKN